MIQRLLKSKKYLVFIVSIALLLFSMTGCAPAHERNWANDIDQFRTFVLETHPKFADENLANIERHMEMRMAFNDSIDTLIADVQNLNDFEILVSMQRAAAILEDNHFCVLSAQLAEKEEIEVYPVGFRFLSDGFYLLTTIERFESALNHRLVSVSGRHIDDVFADFISLWSVENVYHARSAFARMIGNPLLLDAMNLREDEQVIFALEDLNGNTTQITLNTTDKVSMDTLTAVSFPIFHKDSRAEGDLPLFMDIRGYAGNGHNWFEVIAEYDILYIRLEMYMQNADLETGAFAPFSQDVISAFEESSPRTVIIDARHNPGGDNAYLAELFEFLAENTASGMLFHFVDEGSMSASLLGAAHLKSLGAVLVGQPLGQNTVFYGFHTVSHIDGGVHFSDLDFIEGLELDEYVQIGVGKDVYPYFEVLEVTVREILEMVEGGGSEGGDASSSPHLTLRHSGLHISVPNMTLSAPDLFGLDLDFYALRPDVLIEYTIQDWIYNRDPLLAYVIGRLG